MIGEGRATRHAVIAGSEDTSYMALTGYPAAVAGGVKRIIAACAVTVGTLNLSKHPRAQCVRGWASLKAYLNQAG